MPGINHCTQVEQRPAVATVAVARELVLVTVQARDAAKVDHGVRIGVRQGQDVSRSYPVGCVGNICILRRIKTRAGRIPPRKSLA